jgi:hypothetical protein
LDVQEGLTMIRSRRPSRFALRALAVALGATGAALAQPAPPPAMPPPPPDLQPVPEVAGDAEL